MIQKISKKTCVKSINFTFEGKVVCSIQVFSDGALYVNKSLRVNVSEENIMHMSLDNHFQRIYLKE